MPAPFLEPLVPGVPPAVSAWIRGLEEVALHLEGWAFDLPEEAFWWRPKEEANPIGGLVRHIAGSSLRLGAYALGLGLPGWATRGREWELRGEAEPKAVVVARFREAWDGLLAAFREVREEALAEEVAVGHLGVRAPRAHVLHHLVEHAQHHAGQVIYARKLL
ncbi:MAG: DinB family protein [Thermus sp.]|uniref:DinB family protein n=1 Tax=Thermus sp. TaxID=275 RepID=UPI0025F91CCA|nr:DinB family protein [Thermus sp.]MCS6869673.1 DinB family protein [Thermus sp.]MCS7219287.1 DinB family protein [Thermus sp.]MCX7849726.1 DinB family protein [Thermus sp.]MDW8017021.1 DinB family protein [Thermus sp.]MDW8358058.1 DinB family protein [Thermus sp.]